MLAQALRLVAVFVFLVAVFQDRLHQAPLDNLRLGALGLALWCTATMLDRRNP